MVMLAWSLAFGALSDYGTALAAGLVKIPDILYYVSAVYGTYGMLLICGMALISRSWMAYVARAIRVYLGAMKVQLERRLNSRTASFQE
ncbi:hypothetical protein IscW_ISCW003207 [Ixodes scapularis]|uniref:Uncharacterized protein n=1 Tax=Ixodes scapularis TaxID=6945 RepID=B7PC43_IXOSC|nr:hypothetical protein IscW_ISCW003207 [Ixodes scapularis]|eukprot:XP_002409326.1 hypothetical protein IscW_ISCW003207 [Ixodes scapularis]